MRTLTQNRELATPLAMPRRGEPPLVRGLRDLARNRAAAGGLLLLVLLALVAILAPVVAPYDPIKQNWRDILVGPSLGHPFGTDNYGRDVLSRVIYGGQLSLGVGVIAVAIGAGAGVVIGLCSGYYGRLVDAVTMRLMDIMLAFPGIMLAMAIVAVLGGGLVNVTIAVGIGSIPGFARLVRGSVLSAKENVYVEAARVTGARDRRIMGLHLLPNIFAPLLTYATLRVSYAILAVASLSFLGLGAQRPTPEWGVMLADGRDYLREEWWLGTFPGLAIMVTALSINMLGDGLRDVLDPRLRR